MAVKLKSRLGLDDPLAGAGRFDKAQAELVQDLAQDLALFGREIAARLLLEQRQDFDHLRGPVEIRFGRLAGYRVREITEMNGRCAGQRDHERGEGQLRLWLRHLGKVTKCPGA